MWILKEILLNCHSQSVPSHTLTVFAMLFFGWSLLLDYSNQPPLFFQILGSSFTTVVRSSALWAHELDLVLWSSVSYDCILQEIASREMENSSTLGILEQRWTKPLIHISFVNRLCPGAGRPPVVDSLQNGYYYYALSIYILCDVTGQLVPLRGGVYFLSICIWAGLMICFGQ